MIVASDPLSGSVPMIKAVYLNSTRFRRKLILVVFLPAVVTGNADRWAHSMSFEFPHRPHIM
jgi:hypothetical protein